MNHCLTLPIPGTEPAHLTFSGALTPELVDQIEHLLRGQLRRLPPGTTDNSSSRAEAEYASWLLRKH